MMVKPIVLLFGGALLTSAAPETERVQIEEEASPSFRGLPKGWAQLSGVRPEEDGLELMFFIKQQNTEVLESTLLDVSDPTSKNYGKYMTNKQVHDLVRPRQESIDSVTKFLNIHGIRSTHLTPNGDAISARVTIAMAEELLSTEYHIIHHAASNTNVTRTNAYSLPSDVASHVDFVCPTVHIPPAPKKLRASTKGSLPMEGNTPAHLRKLYSVDTVGQMPTNKMAVTAFLNQHYSHIDLNEFYRLFCDGLTCGKGAPIVKGDGSLGIGSGIESMLDIETITGVAGNVTSEFWGYKGKDPENHANEPFFKWLTDLANATDVDVPKVFSTSYGEDEDSWSYASATRMNTEFMKAGARGISLLYAAGDEGTNCKDDKFVPETPGSSPWVTSVGGTTGTKESAIGLSSGGFSNRWPQPAWQKDAVAAYWTHGGGKIPKESVGHYNKSGRAYPDIAAQASDFTVVANLIPNPGVAGTSCASPTASGVIALLNDALLLAGKPVLGFLNPWIYQNAAAWNDIKSGASEGCIGEDDGWPAVLGWDAVTGVGTPNYKNLVKLSPSPAPPSPPPSPGQVCKKSEYCCPDAKHCLTPTNVSCAKDSTICSKDQACCPLTKICVDVGAPCKSPCVDQSSYCCPDALHCLTPNPPGVFCKATSDCRASDVCCPLTNICVSVGAACTPP